MRKSALADRKRRIWLLRIENRIIPCMKPPDLTISELWWRMLRRDFLIKTP